MRTALSVVAGVTLFVLGTTAVLAHHAFSAEFDANRPVQLQGTVTKMAWVNPHAWIHIDVKRPDGSVEKWMIEGGTPNTLLRRGLRKSDLPAPQTASPMTYVLNGRQYLVVAISGAGYSDELLAFRLPQARTSTAAR